ncbi:MAG: hypothetical protein JXA73_22380 [Acidobacteria bacterium]|nr:hypothetical protein [Acidobacteriota bacterium]
MSIDLAIRYKHAIRLSPLLPKIRKTLSDILAVDVPKIFVKTLVDGSPQDVITDVLSEESESFYQFSIEGEPETVCVNWVDEHVNISMTSQRTNLEYALGAAVAIVLAADAKENIEDDWHFFGREDFVSPETLLTSLRLSGNYSNHREAAEQLKLEERL